MHWLENLRRGLDDAGPIGRTIAARLATLEAQWKADLAQKMPESRGDVGAIVGEPFFLPLYKLFRTYGGVFRLTFGPKVPYLEAYVVPCDYDLLDHSEGFFIALLPRESGVITRRSGTSHYCM